MLFVLVPFALEASFYYASAPPLLLSIGMAAQWWARSFRQCMYGVSGNALYVESSSGVVESGHWEENAWAARLSSTLPDVQRAAESIRNEDA